MSWTIIQRPLWSLLLLLILLRPWVASLAFPDMERLWQLSGTACAAFLLGLRRRHQTSALLAASRWRQPLSWWLAALALAAVSSPDPWHAARLGHAILNALLLFLLAAQANDDEAHQIRAVLAISLVGLGGYGLWQAAAGFPNALRYLAATAPHDAFSHDYLASGRVIAAFVSPDIFSAYLIIVGTALAASATDLAMPRHQRRWLMLIVFITLLNLALARSLGAWLSLLATIGLWLIYRPTFRTTASTRRGLWLMLILGTLLAIVITARWETLADTTNPHNPIIQRWRYWQSAVAIWRDHPLLGVGFGGFGTAYESYRLPDASGALFTHNSYLQLGAETGLLGIVPLAWLLATLLRDAIGRCRRGDGVAVWALPGALAFLLHNVVSFDWYLPEVAMHGWLLLGLALAPRQLMTR